LKIFSSVNLNLVIGLSVVLDFVPNHSSEDHEWFQKSINKTEPFTDYYIWNDGVDVDGQRTPPNNWVSFVLLLLYSFKGKESFWKAF